jgi:uncharacterized protein
MNTPLQPQLPKKRSWLLRGFWCLLIAVSAFLALLFFSQEKFIYFPRTYAPAEIENFLQRPGTHKITATTSQGLQTAWLWYDRAAHAGERPTHLWIMCGGNGTVALDLVDFAQKAALPRQAFLFFDYPGYGDCAGRPSPAHIAESARTLIPLAAEKAEIYPHELTERLIPWGHSLGAAAALIIADDLATKRAVIFSPFTSTMDMARHQLRLPLGFLLRHRFDNVARVQSLRARGSQLWIGHGTDDEIIPVTMGRHLAAVAEAPHHYTEMLDGRHNDIFFTHPMVLHELMRRATGISDLTP